MVVADDSVGVCVSIDVPNAMTDFMLAPFLNSNIKSSNILIKKRNFTFTLSSNISNNTYPRNIIFISN